MKCLAVLAFLLFLIGEPILWSQSTDATVSGMVFDPSNRVISNAQILILNEATGVRYSDRKSTRLNSSHVLRSRMPSSA